MGSHPAKALILALALCAAPAAAQEAGWHYSPLPGEGDRAALGCARDATPQDYTCLAVRCEDDFSIGIHVFTSRPVTLGGWDMTIDRETATLSAEAAPGPYGGRFIDQADWLLERIRQGTFIYLGHRDDPAPVAFIDLGGSLQAINAALSFCAPRVRVEPNASEGV